MQMSLSSFHAFFERIASTAARKVCQANRTDAFRKLQIKRKIRILNYV